MNASKLFNENMKLVAFVFTRKFYSYANYKEDLLQEGYLALWKSCLNFNELKNFKFTTYACAAIANAMKTYVKRVIKKHSTVISLNSVISDDGEGSEIHLEETLSDSADIEKDLILEDIMHKLPLKEQAILKRILEGYTQNQVAVLCHTSQPTVSRCLQRFKNLLLGE